MFRFRACNMSSSKTFARTLANSLSSGGQTRRSRVRQSVLDAVSEQAADLKNRLGRTDQQTSQSNTMTFPKDETTPWQSTGGIQAYWDGEAAQYTPSKPKLEPSTIRLNKLTALVPVNGEMREAPATGQVRLRADGTPEHLEYDTDLGSVTIEFAEVGEPAQVEEPDTAWEFPGGE